MTDLLFAASDRSFGANQFYGDYPSWERTKGWFGGVRQELGSQTEAAFAYRRHTDEFVLLRDDPAIYENNHIDGSWQASLRRTENLPAGALLLMGLEADGDSIDSYNFSGACVVCTWHPCAQSRRGVRGPGSAAGEEALELVGRGARGDFFGRSAGGVFSGAGGKPARGEQPEAARQRRIRIQDSDVHRSLLLRSVDAGKSELEAGVGVVGRRGRGLDAVGKVTLSVTGFYSQQHDTIDYVKSRDVPNAYLPAGCPAPTSGARTI